MSYVVGAAFIIVPIASVLYQRYMIANGIKVHATVLRVEKVLHHRGLYYHAVLRYAVDGKEYEIRSSTGLSIPLHAEGDIVTMYCHKNRPQEVVEQSTSSCMVNVLCVIIMIVGIIIMISGIFPG